MPINTDENMATNTAAEPASPEPIAALRPLVRASQGLGLAGFGLYALAAPHSIAVSWIGLSFAVLGWLARTLATWRPGLRRTPLDLPLWLFFAWTALSCFLSEEPRVSVPKLINVSTLLMFYLTQALVTRRTAVLLAALMILSGSAGALWGAGELAVGRGVVVKGLSVDSSLRRSTPLREGDAVWRVNERRVSTVEEIDEAIRRTPAGERLKLSVISHGEHVEWPGAAVNEEMRGAPSPSGITEGGGRTHSFRASGWTRHYETFAEVLQIVAQLALGFALAVWLRERGKEVRSSSSEEQRARRWVWLAGAAFAMLAAGIALTAMRTTLVAFAFGAGVVAWRAAARGRQRALVAAAVAVVLALGAAAVWRTRATGALRLGDASASLRLQVARVAVERIHTHPLFGHGMDAVHAHWAEWGFPGSDMLHAHSTPIQLAFDRGLPALLFWLWLMYVLWRLAARAERLWRDSAEASTHGLALGITGALAGFLASSIVNYNFGDAEVALLVWWMMGVVVTLNDEG
ncbi:MAG: O-antigen ligase family protein [Pyrinomonadaceae bacterium]